MAVVCGEKGSVRAVASWTSSTGGDMGRGAAEDAGDSLERLTEAEDMRDKWVMLRLCAIGTLLSLHQGFSGGSVAAASATSRP